MEQARNRVTFGEPIANRQAIQWMIADSAVEIEALRWLVLTAAWQVDHGVDSRQAQSMAKLYGGVQANQIVDRVLQIHGGMGYTRELPIERWYRELRLLRIYEGTDEIQRRTIARNLLSGHASVRGSPGLIDVQALHIKEGHRGEHGAHVRDLVRAEEVGPPEPGEDREETLGLAELVLEQVEGVGQRIADRYAEAA